MGCEFKEGEVPRLSKRQELISKALDDFPNATYRSIAKKLHTDHPFLFPTSEHARAGIKTFTGHNGAKSRHSAARASRTKPPRKSHPNPTLPPSLAKPWTPHTLNAKRVLVLSDLHLPYHDVPAVEAAIKHGQKFNPDAILINGDLFDFYQISRYDRDPTKPKLLAELEAGKQFFAYLRRKFKKATIALKLGNHDERWDAYLFRCAPLLFDIDSVRNAWHEPAGIQKYGIEVIGEQRPIMVGLLPVFHGHELGRSLFNPVNPARGAFLRAHHTILIGHSHQTSGHADTNLWHEETFCWSTGCLCQLTPEYARVNRWNHGFAEIEVARNGEFNVNNLRIAAGSVRSS